MDIIRYMINNPVKVTVGVLLTCLFGVLALFQIPIQLTPNVDEPIVTVTTRWPGKSAREVEREIIDRQEEKLKGVSGLRKMTSEAVEGQATITLEFFIGTDMDSALREADEKLNQVTGYPLDMEKPELESADTALASPIAWILLKARDGSDVSTLRDFVWDEVKPILERVEGLSSVDVYGGREREVHVLADPARLAARSLTLRDLEAAMQRENITISAGTIEIGKRDFIYRTVGEYDDPMQVSNTVIAYRDGGPVFVRDVARVIRTHEKARSFVRSKGQPVLAIPARRETGANVISVMEGLRKQIDKVNREILQGRNLELELTQVYDETVYIRSAIDLVRSNFFYGGILAVLVLMFYLRNVRATGVVALSIPISVVATFLVVSLLGRNLNVVMLAGMAFAVGMVVDNAIVVLENIYRHRQMGKGGFQAALEGAAEVWGAILASSLTTVAVFVPVIFIQEEAGQLFRDLAVAISTGVLMSLLVAILVIPTVSARLLGGTASIGEDRVSAVARLVGRVVAYVERTWPRRLAVIAVFLVASIGGSIALRPPSDYLPSGNRNLVFGFLITEPGLSLDALGRIAREVEGKLRPYWEAGIDTPQAEALPPVTMMVNGRPVQVRVPPIENFFFVAFNNSAFMGITSQDSRNVIPLQTLMQQVVASTKSATGSYGFFQQVPLFGRVGRGNTVDVEIRGQDLSKVNAAGELIFMECIDQFKFARPNPSNFDLPRPEIRAVPDRARAADVGLSVRDIGFILGAAVDGVYVGGFREEGDEVDLRVKLENIDGTPIGGVRNVPVYTPAGSIVPLSLVTKFEEVGAAQQINHIEAMPGVTIQVLAPPGQAVGEVMDTIENRIVARLRGEGKISPDVFVSLAGTADKLVQTRAAMFGQWTGWNWHSLLALVQSRGFLALLVVYLLMAGLFESFVHPLSIMLTVPLAAVGGFLGLRVVHTLSLYNPTTPVQQLDVVTMLGFVILVGIVVNNAILIVHQTLNNISYGMRPEEALPEAVRTRVRPIFMTAYTTIFGQLPLALMPGAGSELYRGLAAVMVGGLFVATVFTLILVPVVFSISLKVRERILARFGREARSGRAVALALPGDPPPASGPSSTPTDRIGG
ncbi:MAG TPA: efflux RND transporter permease subunit [Phycisphaerae bacterium]|nr:efflux RND transporter permease subunit [Phycisphaerae bacterium]